MARKLLSIDHVSVERSEIEETGEYNLDGLFIRLAHMGTGSLTRPNPFKTKRFMRRLTAA
ncbi:MAG TPA: hypothetical protein VLW85_19275 [Myxococcales bacterium]|nr:hypothetical protein [Myxococcales bacterium]